MVVRWTFHDPSVPETYTVPINPNEGGTPGKRKNIGYANTAAPDGKTLVYEGRDEPDRMRFSGTILTQAHLEAFQGWFAKRRQVRITDDLGREFWVYIESFEPKRVRSALHPWKHDFEMDALVLSWA